MNREGRENLNQYRVYDESGIAPALNKMDGGGREPHVIAGLGEKKSNSGSQWYQQDRIYDTDAVSPALSKDKSDLNIIDPRYRKIEGGVRLYEDTFPTLSARDYKEPLMVKEHETETDDVHRSR